MLGSLHKHVGRKNGNACNVRNAAWHFVTVTVLHATEKGWKNGKIITNGWKDFKSTGC